jgi:hypothetical protein
MASSSQQPAASSQQTEGSRLRGSRQQTTCSRHCQTAGTARQEAARASKYIEEFPKPIELKNIKHFNLK